MSNLARNLVVIEAESGNKFALEMVDGALKLLHNPDIETASEKASFDAGMLQMTDVRNAAFRCNYLNDSAEFATGLYKALQASLPLSLPMPSGYPMLPGRTASKTWPIPRRYSLGRELGSGAYGCVRQAWDEDDKRRVAVKEVELRYMPHTDQTRILREMKLLRSLKHSHIIQIFDVYFSEEEPEFAYMILECCDIDLSKLLRSGPELSKPVTQRLAYNLCVGVQYLHAMGVYHRDLKPANCLANEDCSVKICDFNLSKLVGNEGGTSDDSVVQTLQRSHTQHVVTRWYRAPEVILELRYTEALDVWSFGCILAELFRALNKRYHRSGPLFKGGPTDMSVSGARDSSSQLGTIIAVLGTPSASCDSQFADLPSSAKDRINNCEWRGGSTLRDQVPPETPEEGKDLLCDSLKFFPDARITMVGAVQHHFFNGVKRSPSETVEDVKLDLDFNESQLQRQADFVQEFQKEHEKHQVK